jgi:coenzyme PQQ precursor peptide PqqA
LIAAGYFPDNIKARARNSSQPRCRDDSVLPVPWCDSYCFLSNNKERDMAWKTPRVIEIAVGMEINCYACAEL